MALWEEMKQCEDAYSAFDYDRYLSNPSDYSQDEVDMILKHFKFKVKFEALTDSEKDVRKSLRSHAAKKKFPFSFNDKVEPYPGTGKKHVVLGGKDFVFQISRTSPNYLECYASRSIAREQTIRQSARVFFRINRAILKEMIDTLKIIEEKWGSWFKE